MKLFIKNHLYAIFVVLLVLVAGGVYLASHSEPVVALSTQQRHLVRHEKDENKLTMVEQYFEKKIARRFTVKEVKEISMFVIIAALILLICQPLILWYVISGRQKQKHSPDSDEHHFMHHYQNPYRIDHDTDKNFKIM